MSLEEETVTSPLPESLDSAKEAKPAEAAPVDATASSPADALRDVLDPEVATGEEGERQERKVEIQYGTNANAELHQNVFNAGTDKERLRYRDYERLSVIGATSAESYELSANYPNLTLGQTEPEVRWEETAREASNHMFPGGAFEGALKREDSMWRNSVPSGAQNLHVSKPKFESTEGERLTGEAAMMRIQSLMGLGSTARVPLWHSGIWITLKAPTEAALLELERRIASDKVQLGRLSKGLVFSNSSVYTLNYLTDFVLAHVLEATYRFTDVSELKPLILAPDIYLMVHGLLCTMYPNGYPYTQPCVVDPTKCLHVINEMISIPRLCFTDHLRLTDWQRNQMTRRMAKFTREEIQRYQSEHRFLDERTVQLTDQVKMELHVPTIEQYVQVGVSWVDSIIGKVDKAFGPSVPAKEREAYILDQARVTSMCQYAHWVKSIVMEDERGNTQIIDDPTTVSDTLATITSNTEAYKNYYEGIQKFIDASTLSIIATPKVPCPKCGEAPNEEESKHPYLLPLDIVTVFFTLLDRRLIKIFQQDG